MSILDKANAKRALKESTSVFFTLIGMTIASALVGLGLIGIGYLLATVTLWLLVPYIALSLFGLILFLVWEDPEEINVNVRKNRNGPVNKVVVEYTPQEWNTAKKLFNKGDLIITPKDYQDNKRIN